MIVDSHTHLGVFPLFNVKLDVNEMLEIMKKHKIEKSVVFSLPNELTLQAVEKYPQKIIGFIWLNPHKKDSVQLLEKAVTKWNFKGIKMHPLIDSFLPDQPITHPIMEKAEKYRIPVLFHCGHPPWSLPWHFKNLADSFPNVNIILGHMGHGHIVYINGAIEVAKKCDNIFLETSGMPMHSKIKEAVLTVGEERVLYGSDMPFGHPAFEIKKVETAGLNEHQLELVLGLNAKKLLQI